MVSRKTSSVFLVQEHVNRMFEVVSEVAREIRAINLLLCKHNSNDLYMSTGSYWITHLQVCL